MPSPQGEGRGRRYQERAEGGVEEGDGECRGWGVGKATGNVVVGWGGEGDGGCGGGGRVGGWVAYVGGGGGWGHKMLWWEGGDWGKKHKIWGLQAGRCSLCSVPSSNASRGDPHVQFALGSVLKLMGSAFGGLGSFRVPSIRRALPVLLGGLLCSVGTSAMAQTITGVEIVGTPGTDQTYSTEPGSGSTGKTPANNNQFSVKFTFSSAVSSGSGAVIVDVGGKKRSLACGSPSGTTTMTCGPYTVTATDVDADGVSVPANSLTGDYPALGHEELEDQSGHKVDGMSPSVASVVVTSDPGSDGAYRRGDTVTATITLPSRLQFTAASNCP